MEQTPRQRMTQSPQWPWIAASSVLTTFDPDRLKPLGGNEPDVMAVADMVMEYAEPIRVGPARGQWRLREDIRRRALSALGTADALRQALDANVDDQSMDLSARALRELVTIPSPLSLAKRSLEELVGLDRALGWLDATPISSPTSRDEVTRHVERQKLLDPMSRLTVGFEGRAKELEDLRTYVDTLPSQTWAESIARLGNRFKYVFTAHPPLVISGPGGAGKSTLVAKFILDHAGREQKSPMAFVLLDFDRSTLDATRPDALLVEVARQLRVQFPEHADGLSDLAEATDYRLVSEDDFLPNMSSHYGESDMIRAELAALMNNIAAETGRNILFVIDTFEIVQRRGPSAVYALLDFAADLLDRVRPLRVVIVGRGELRPEDFSFASDAITGKPLPLKGFDVPAGRAYLRARLPATIRRSVNDADLDRLVLRVRGNALGLRLAAQVFAREGQRGVDEAIGPEELSEAIADEQVQGLLHARIVEHLDDPNLKKVASPGLIVRRITRDVIEQVLAEPCGLQLEPTAVGALFESLRREVSLVELVDPDTVRHRSDVRLIMLPALRRDLGALAGKVDAAAVRYWSQQKGAAARAEEIYHRLWRRDSQSELDAAWRPDAAGALEDALDEFSTVAPDDWSRIWLAEKLDRELPEDLRKRSDQIAFERDVERKARRLLSDGKTEQALKVLHERSSDHWLPGSALWLLDIDARLLRGDTAAASTTLARAWALLTPSGYAGHRAALLSRKVTIEERLDQLESARSTATDAMSLAHAARDPVSIFSCGLSLVRLGRKTDRRDDPEMKAQRAELMELLDDAAVQRALADRPSLLREAAAELGAEQPALIADALERLGVEFNAMSAGIVWPESISEIVRELGGSSRTRGLGRASRDFAGSLAEYVRGNRLKSEVLTEIANLYASSVDKFIKQIIS